MPSTPVKPAGYGGTKIHGHCDGRFGALREAFERNFAERGEVGASFAATLDGEYVADLWAGYRDAAGTLPWQEDTIVCVYSVTKTMCALAVLVLFDRGELDFDDLVVRYWPEYGQNGKEATRLRHIMGHTAGLPAFGERLTIAELCDWDHAAGVLERQAPSWRPGEACAYHALTQGFLLGEIVRRITGASLGAFFRENVAVPLGADFHIGLPPLHHGRTGEMIAGGQMPEKLQAYMRRQQSSSPSVQPPTANSESFRSAEIPAVNGHGNARSVVRVQTAVANGGRAFGVELVSPSTIGQIFREQGYLKGMRARLGIGYGLQSALTSPIPKGAKTCFWAGGGGSTVILDHTNRVCMSYVMNRMELDHLGDRRGTSLTKAFYEGLGAG